MGQPLFIAAGSVLLLLFSFGADAAAAKLDNEVPSQKVFALIIGETAPSDPKTAPLRFADDDAFANYKLMVQLAQKDHVVIFTDADKETRALYPDIPSVSPTKDAIHTAMAALNRKMKTLLSNGIRPVFYFFYTGHGDVKNNEGFVTIADGRFFRADLMRLLKTSEADVNHVIIDACKSYFMVQTRGKGTRRPISYGLPIEDEDLPRRTGFFLSTSSDADSHEWEVFQGGVFSHELRSALRGAADLDGNLVVTYEEAAAFINRANASIPAERFRPNFFARPPDEGSSSTAVLTDLRSADGTRLSLKAEPSMHQYIEDGQGSRLLDVHPAPGKSVTVLVPKQRPLFVRFPSSGTEISVPKGDVVDIGDTDFVPRRVATRGAEHEAFVRLFALPFDNTAIGDYRLLQMEAAVKDTLSLSPKGEWVRRSLAIGGSIFLAAGGVFTGVAVAAHRSLDATSSGVDIYNANERIHTSNAVAIPCYAAGGVALASYLIWTVRAKHRRQFRTNTLRSSVDEMPQNLHLSVWQKGIAIGGAF